ncbi:MAG: hypothetical protein J07HN4v3_00094 [Halonotius sp. J07HN4]|nr:MAG: hypothetical protein J07HN4v3_00094 [Halonotius sp. J07HN4]
MRAVDNPNERYNEANDQHVAAPAISITTNSTAACQ